jgi:hypothetical protein
MKKNIQMMKKNILVMKLNNRIVAVIYRMFSSNSGIFPIRFRSFPTDNHIVVLRTICFAIITRMMATRRDLFFLNLVHLNLKSFISAIPIVVFSGEAPTKRDFIIHKSRFKRFGYLNFDCLDGLSQSLLKTECLWRKTE